MTAPIPLPAPHDRGLVFDGTTPCGHWIKVEDRFCGEVPTRYFAQGHRCVRCTPAAVEARAAARAAADERVLRQEAS